MLVSEVDGTLLRMALRPTLADGTPFTYNVRAGGHLAKRWRIIEAQLAALEAADQERHGMASGRPGRVQLVHMRSRPEDALSPEAPDCRRQFFRISWVLGI